MSLFLTFSLLPAGKAQAVLSHDPSAALHRGMYELMLHATGDTGNPYYGITFKVTLQLEKGNFRVKWFDPDTGAWYYDNNIEGGADLSLKAPGIEDWILVLEKI